MAGIISSDGDMPPGGPKETGESYASRVLGRSKTGRKKLNVLDIILERKDKNISFNLNKEELARLLFKKMKLEPKVVLKIDTSGYAKIQVELTDSINLEDLVGLPSYDIKDGLRTKLYRPHHRKETLVTINWLDLETPDDLIMHVFNHFGKVKSGIQWCKIKEEEGDSHLAKLLNNIMSGDRQFWMDVNKPIPSYAIIDGRKVKIYHAGQRRTCARCQKTAEHCLGNSNARLCEENGGEKVKVEEIWKDILKEVDYKEWKGVEKKEIAAEEGNEDEDRKDELEHIADVSNCDGMVLSNLEEDCTIEDVKKILKGALNEADLETISIHPTGSTRSKLIKDIKNDIASVANKIDGKSYHGRLLHCRPHVAISPVKKTDSTEDKTEEQPDVNSANSTPEETDPKAVSEEENENAKVTVKVTKEAFVIPGLPIADQDKAKKLADKKQKDKS